MTTDLRYCKSCRAPIYFLRKEGTENNPNPIDANKCLPGTGNITINLEAGTYRVVGKGNGDHVSHFVTCPDREKFRKGRGAHE